VLIRLTDRQMDGWMDRQGDFYTSHKNIDLKGYKDGQDINRRLSNDSNVSILDLSLINPHPAK